MTWEEAVDLSYQMDVYLKYKKRDEPGSGGYASILASPTFSLPPTFNRQFTINIVSFIPEYLSRPVYRLQLLKYCT